MKFKKVIVKPKLRIKRRKVKHVTQKVNKRKFRLPKRWIRINKIVKAKVVK